MGVAKVPGMHRPGTWEGDHSWSPRCQAKINSEGPVSTRAGTRDGISVRVPARQETGPPGGTERPLYPFARFTYETRKV